MSELKDKFYQKGIKTRKITIIRNYFSQENIDFSNTSLSDIAKQFKISGGDIWKYASDLIKKHINTTGTFTDEKGEYCILEKIPAKIGLSYSAIKKFILKNTIPYKKHLFQPFSGSRKVITRKFYHLESIFKINKKYKDLFNLQILPEDHILKRLPKESKIFAWDYYIFIIMLKIKIKTHRWPSYNGIKSAIKDKYPISTIKRSVDSLINNSFMTEINNEYCQFVRNTRAFMIHKGPREYLIEDGEPRHFCSKNCITF